MRNCQSWSQVGQAAVDTGAAECRLETSIRLDLFSLISVFSSTSMSLSSASAPSPPRLIYLLRSAASLTFILSHFFLHKCPPPPLFQNMPLPPVCVHLLSCSGDTSEASSARSLAVLSPLFRTQSFAEGEIGAFGQDASSDWLSTVQIEVG